MSSKIHHTELTINALMALIDLIADPKKYADAVLVFTEQRKEMLTLITQVSKVKEIEINMSRTKTELHQAKATVEKAKSDAAKIVDNAQQKCHHRETELHHREARFDDDLKSFNKAKADNSTATQAAEKRLNKRQAAVDHREVEAEAKFQAAVVLEKQYLDKMNYLKQMP